MQKILSFGELLLRMSPQSDGGWIRQQQMPVYVGGAEANVATALAVWRIPARYVTALPLHYLGDDIVSYLERRGIDTGSIHRSGERVGMYYLQQGADLKHAGVIYDRVHSSFYDLRPGMIDWNEAFRDVGRFHFSAITPALHEGLAMVCREAVEAAVDKGISVSVDLNYRAPLWRKGRRPADVMPELVQHCSLVMGNIWSANTLLGIPLDERLLAQHSREAYLAHSVSTAEAIMERFPKCSAVAQTFRFGGEGEGLDYYTTLQAGGEQYVSPHFRTERVLDKIGSGDCFMAGLLYGYHLAHEPQRILDFATAAAFGKLQEIGDATSQTVAQVQEILRRRLF